MKPDSLISHVPEGSPGCRQPQEDRSAHQSESPQWKSRKKRIGIGSLHIRVGPNLRLSLRLGIGPAWQM